MEVNYALLYKNKLSLETNFQDYKMLFPYNSDSQSFLHCSFLQKGNL